MEIDKGVDKKGSGPIKVLIIPLIVERNYAPLLKLLDPDFQQDFTFYTIAPVPRRENRAVNYEQMLEKCSDLIKEVKIDVLYANKRTGSLLKAVLCKQFPHLKGPSVESVFLCNHKYYTTLLVDSRQQKLPYHLEGIDKDRYDTTHHLLSSVQLPCIVRACLGSGHSVYCAHNRDDLLKVLDKCKFDIMHIVDIQRWLLQDHIDKHKYPLATRHVVLFNSFLDRCTATAGSTWISVCIEACVWQLEIIPWAICDVVTLPYGSKDVTHIFPGYEMPTKLSAFQQETLWKEFCGDIQNLMTHGFNNSFVYGEYMVFEDGYVHLVSLNSSTNTKVTSMYQRALNNGNNIQAEVQTALSLRPVPPKLNGKYVLSYTMYVLESGKADNLIHFDRALKYPSVTLYFLPQQDIVIEPAKDFAVIGCITVTGSGFPECMEEVKDIRTNILKLAELVPLTY